MTTTSLHLLHQYFGAVRSYFEDHPDRDAVTDLSALRPSAEWARREAERRGELDALLAAIDFVLAHDDHELEMTLDLSLPEIIHDDEGYRSGDVLREILRYYRAVIWPEGPAPQLGVLDVVTTDLDQWRRLR
jgi:hypothetical protein